MHRCGFLAAGLATVLASPRALAQMLMDGMSNMDSMPGTDMNGHAGYYVGAMVQGPVSLPEGEALHELQLGMMGIVDVQA